MTLLTAAESLNSAVDKFNNAFTKGSSNVFPLSYLLTFSRLSLADEICINDGSPLISYCKISRASEQAAIASVCSAYLYWKEA